MRLLGFASLLLLAMSGCNRSTRPWIDRLSVDAFEGGEVISLSKEQLREQVLSRLKAAQFQVAEGVPVPKDVRPWRIELAAGLTEPEIEEGESFVLLAVDVRHTGEEEPFALTSKIKVRPPADHDVEAMQAAIRGALDEALTNAVNETAAVINLEGTAPDALAGRLASGPAPEKKAALRLLVRKHDKRALPLLLAQLKTEEIDQLHEAIGLLVELKAPESVNPLIDAARQKGPVFEREVVFAVGSIGGGDAEAYLDLIASGHDDPLVRASAEQALSELRGRSPRKPLEEKAP